MSDVSTRLPHQLVHVVLSSTRGNDCDYRLHARIAELVELIHPGPPALDMPLTLDEEQVCDIGLEKMDAHWSHNSRRVDCDQPFVDGSKFAAVADGWRFGCTYP